MAKLRVTLIFTFVLVGTNNLNAHFFSPLEIAEAFRENPNKCRETYAWIGNFSTYKRKYDAKRILVTEEHLATSGDFSFIISYILQGPDTLSYGLDMYPLSDSLINILEQTAGTFNCSYLCSYWENRDYNSDRKHFEEFVFRDTMASLLCSNHDSVNLDVLYKDYMWFMASPYSGLVMGHNGGYASSWPLKVTRLYEFMEDKLNPYQLRLLMQASNPYVRAMSAVYYREHKRKFRKHRSEMKRLVSKLLKDEQIIVKVSGACIRLTYPYTVREYIIVNTGNMIASVRNSRKVYRRMGFIK